MLTRAALIFLIIIFASQLQATKQKSPDTITLQASVEPTAPAGYSARLIRLFEYSSELTWDPAETLLNAQTRSVIKHLGNLDQPLLLVFLPQRYTSTVLSVSSTSGVDSFLVDTDRIRVYFKAHILAGTIDTLIIVFQNRTDFTNGNYAVESAGQKGHYYGLKGCLPFPEYPGGNYNADFNITAPESLTAVTLGRLIDQQSLEGGFLRQRRRTDYPDVFTPAFIIDAFKVDRYKSQDATIEIYHHSRPSALINRLASDALEILGKYEQWFGPAPYDSIRLVDNILLGYDAYSQPGIIDLGSDIFEDTSAANGGTLDYEAYKVMAHELAHQWWGAKVHSIENRGMMESFAELMSLHAITPDDEKLKKHVRNRLYPSALSSVKQVGDLPLIETSDDLTRFYYKGPAVLYMLERLIGKEAFFSSLKQFQQEFAYREKSSLDEFLALIGQHYPDDLGWFRREWFERADAPEVIVRQEITPLASGYECRLILTQQTAPFDLPLEAGVFLGGSSVPETRQFRLNQPVDTVAFQCPVVLDSVLLDPDSRTLIGVYREVSADLMPRGDTPHSDYPYTIDIYLDSTRVFDYIKAVYSVDNQTSDTVAVDPAGLFAGYGHFDIPPQPVGSRVSYHLVFMENSGVKQVFPPGAPMNALSFLVKPAPEDWNQVYISFENLAQVPSTSITANAFRQETSGIVGLDRSTLQPFGRLNGVGNRAPQLDIERNRLITFNNNLNTVDIIDLKRWALTRRIQLNGSILFMETSALDWKNNKYFLLEDNKILEIDLSTGQSYPIFETGTAYPKFSWLPRQMLFYPGRNLLMAKAGLHVLLIDTRQGSIVADYKLSNSDMPFLRSDGSLFTVGFRAETKQAGGGFYLQARHFRTSSGKLEPVDSVRSASFQYGASGHLTPEALASCGIVGTAAVDYQENPETVVLWLRSDAGYEANNTLLWDLSGAADTLFTWTYIGNQYNDYARFLDSGADKQRILFTSSLVSTLSVIDLNTLQVELPYLSPFTGHVFDTPMKQSVDRITGMALPVLRNSSQPGDINADGKMDIYDLLELLRALGNAWLQTGRMDLNADSKTDVFDLLLLLRML